MKFNLSKKIVNDELHVNDVSLCFKLIKLLLAEKVDIEGNINYDILEDEMRRIIGKELW